MDPSEDPVGAILAVANQKGGVGKTTTATSLAHGLALAGRKVLLLDLDPQANATSGLGLDPVAESPVFDGPGLADGIVESPWRDVWAVPAGHDLQARSDRGLPRGNELRDGLAVMGDGRFDAVLMDCPPSLGPLTQAALAAADGVLVPIQCEYYPLEGLVQLLRAVRAAGETNRGLAVAGILLTMYDPAAALAREVEGEVRSKLEEPVFEAVIPRDPAVSEAPSHCRSVIDYAPRSPGARGYVDLTLEVVDRGIVA
jgi:chromosome partitioning protein